MHPCSMLCELHGAALVSQIEARLNVGDAEDAGAAVSLAEDVYGPFSGQARSRACTANQLGAK